MIGKDFGQSSGQVLNTKENGQEHRYAGWTQKEITGVESRKPKSDYK